MILTRPEWLERARTHEQRVDVRVQPHLERRHQGIAHPVHDFLFTYYSQRPAALRRWHPGFGVRLEDAPEYDGVKGYVAGTVCAEHVAAQLPVVEAIRTLLAATAARPATLGCFGLHEWAMAYRSETPGNEIRHPWPLRLGPTGTDQVVEGNRIGCSQMHAT
ncbi:MAG: hypothetical protein NTV23_14170 [Propionibacteriales bacterium]|nr:hypothetical protein [Propionibacteriales bacterium]